MVARPYGIWFSDLGVVGASQFGAAAWVKRRTGTENQGRLAALGRMSRRFGNLRFCRGLLGLIGKMSIETPDLPVYSIPCLQRGHLFAATSAVRDRGYRWG